MNEEYEKVCTGECLGKDNSGCVIVDVRDPIDPSAGEIKRFALDHAKNWKEYGDGVIVRHKVTGELFFHGGE